jgi:hypothetical protein
VFYVNVPIGVVAFLGIYAYMHETGPMVRKLDVFGFGTLSIAIAALQLFVHDMRGTAQSGARRSPYSARCRTNKAQVRKAAVCACPPPASSRRVVGHYRS